MHIFGKIVFLAVILSLLLSGCTTKCYDIHQRIQPGMSYKEVSKELGKEGEPYTIAETEPQTIAYQWYVDDYMRIIMYFSSADTKSESVLYKYDITYGCSYFKEGMTYQEFVARLGSPYTFETWFHYAGATWKIHDYLFLSVRFSEQNNEDRACVYPADYIALSFRVDTRIDLE